MPNKPPKRDRKTPKYRQDELLEENSINNFRKDILLLVKGNTEAAYFDKLRRNSYLDGSLASVKIEVAHDIKTARAIEKDNKEAHTIWFVTDNDKGNAFVLGEKTIPFFTQLTDNQLPRLIREKLYSAYDSDKHNYFLSIHDYLTWVSSAIGAEDAILFWDRIQHHTPEKNRDFEKFIVAKNENETKLQLAYSCIAFEFWLLLHFEQNNTPFLWVDKDKDITVDVMTAFKKCRKEYEKGYFV